MAPLKTLFTHQVCTPKIYVQDGCHHDLNAFPMTSKCLGLCDLKLKLSGASIAYCFNRPKRTESYKNDKSNILTPNYKQLNPTLLFCPFKCEVQSIWSTGFPCTNVLNLSEQCLAARHYVTESKCGVWV